MHACPKSATKPCGGRHLLSHTQSCQFTILFGGTALISQWLGAEPPFCVPSVGQMCIPSTMLLLSPSMFAGGYDNVHACKHASALHRSLVCVCSHYNQQQNLRGLWILPLKSPAQHSQQFHNEYTHHAFTPCLTVDSTRCAHSVTAVVCAFTAGRHSPRSAYSACVCVGERTSVGEWGLSQDSATRARTHAHPHAHTLVDARGGQQIYMPPATRPCIPVSSRLWRRRTFLSCSQ